MARLILSSAILLAGLGATQARPLIAPGQAGGPVTQMLLGAACGALAVCGLQFLMVVLSEMDLNPVIVHAEGCVIVDALVVARKPSVTSHRRQAQ